MEHIFGRAPKGPAPPARGAVAGVKADLERAKEGGDPRNPNGVGAAWSHHFLNQKPWHPMNFKNRMRVWEHEQEKTQQEKAKEKAQAEFDAEQEYLKTLSYLSAEEQRRYKEVQSVSFMYTKPPGLDAALARDAEAEKKKASQPAAALEGPAAGAAAAPGAAAAAAAPSNPQQPPQQPPQQQERSAVVERLREDPFTSMLAARQALQNNPKFVALQREVGAFGGFSASAANQQLLGEEPAEGAGQGSAELEFLLSLPADQQLRALRRIAKKRKKEEEERQLREAEAVLRAAAAAGTRASTRSRRSAASPRATSIKRRTRAGKPRSGDGAGRTQRAPRTPVIPPRASLLGNAGRGDEDKGVC
ncbi:hypothetical protein Agub_g13356 [Astrephomene gubernaculifera]|uniref:CBF1-interacting co-repressor CIR N-terminal domain-containing protein n=1 Tax=Astrephomene gubernaculifera TaxID=47775 RepID=A0AAD3DZU0_9CHLO|nr:hypothetical protein Agub_g13356 [Astrephomene gubernaculifera]